jgi:hypothetical protein
MSAHAGASSGDPRHQAVVVDPIEELLQGPTVVLSGTLALTPSSSQSPVGLVRQ